MGTYFQFSSACDRQEDLNEWFTWFKNQGVGCAIVFKKLVSRGVVVKKYVLYKEGPEWVAKRSGETGLVRSILKNSTVHIVGKIVRKFDPRKVFVQIH